MSLTESALARFKNFFARKNQISYAQSGEDVILAYLFRWIGIENPTYLDIGAHHPTWLSNTYLFYRRGSSGVCVEPDPDCHRRISSRRKRDICLNVGVSVESATHPLKLYVMTSRTLNTFSKEEAERYQATKNYGEQRIEAVIDVPVRTINEIMEDALPDGVNLVSMDIEGLDYDVLQEFNFSRYQPDAFCVESLRYQEDGSLQKNRDMIAFMETQGYKIYADTYMNTIFVSERAAARIR